MLAIQKFIAEHPADWADLLSAAPYNLYITEQDGFVLFKYNQISSDFNEQICKEARGLILDGTDGFKVVRLAFTKFFNIDEPFAAHIDWNTAVATEKIDGSIMSVWYARGQWHISTNGTIDAFKAPIAGVGRYNNFGELFTSVLNFDTIEKHLNRRYCYTFELVSPYTKVVIDYPETALYLLSIRDMASLQEKTFIPYGFCEMLGVRFPQEWRLNTEKEYRKIVENMTKGHEGIVVRDAAGQRVKIKTLLYFEMHRARNNGVLTLERAVGLILQNDHHEFLSYFPEYTNYFNSLEAIIDGIFTIANAWDNTGFKEKWEEQFSEKVARKQFAQNFATQMAGGLQALAFKCYDKGGERWLKFLTPAQWTRVFAHQLSFVKGAV